MTTQVLNKLTARDYLSMERVAETKSEFFNGEIFAMAGASRKHNQITSNLVRLVGNQIQDRSCSIYSADMKVKVENMDKYTYPDVVLSCEDELFEDENEDVLLSPIIIIEVLSDSTEAYDRGDKFLHYQNIESLKEYILFSQKTYLLEHYIKKSDNQWLYQEYHQLGDKIHLKSVDCFINLDDAYSKVFTKNKI
ncbi:MAG: Uma2 family endonuclease [gamma proteobacterium symbiont of Taylorina sp.]|nr:Uma2 family endonuclease [gamma proteobacterium symbiont of Taylorina sp.]